MLDTDNALIKFTWPVDADDRASLHVPSGALIPEDRAVRAVMAFAKVVAESTGSAGGPQMLLNLARLQLRMDRMRGAFRARTADQQPGNENDRRSRRTRRLRSSLNGHDKAAASVGVLAAQ